MDYQVWTQRHEFTCAEAAWLWYGVHPGVAINEVPRETAFEIDAIHRLLVAWRREVDGPGFVEWPVAWIRHPPPPCVN